MMHRRISLFVMVSLFLSSCVAESSSIQYAAASSTIRFPDSWTIYAVSDEILLLQGYLQINNEINSTLFRSENGGKDWIEVYAPPKPINIPFSSNLILYGRKYEFSFLDDGTGWLVSTWSVSGEGQYILTVDATNNFGNSWSRVGEINAIPSYELLATSFFDELHGQVDLLYTGTTNDRIAFITTMDGGITWKETGSFSLHKAFWNGDKSEYFNVIKNYVDTNFPHTPHATSYGDRHWKLEAQQGASEILILKRTEGGEWARIGSFP